MDARRREEALRLADDALAQLELGSGSLTPITLKCLRLARLINSPDGEAWFRLELQGYKTTVNTNWARYAVFSGREATKTAEGQQNYWIDPIEQVELNFESARNSLHALVLPSTLPATTRELRYMEATDAEKILNPLLMQRRLAQASLTQWGKVIASYRGALQEWLSRVTIQMRFSAMLDNAFERAKSRVDTALSKTAPDAARALAAAFERANSLDAEEWSQALTSCRRALKALADALYPATAEVIDGHELTDDKFVNRIRRFVAENVSSASRRKFVLTNVEAIADRAEVLNDLASRGVHAAVDEHDLELAIVQTYFIAGELLALLPQPSIDLPVPSPPSEHTSAVEHVDPAASQESATEPA